MPIHAAIIGILFIGQVNSLNDRYTGGQQTPAASQSEGRAVPLSVAPPADESRERSQLSGSSTDASQGAADPYKGQANPPAAGSQRSYPLGNTSAPPPAGVKPPDFDDFPAERNATAEQPIAGERTRGLKPTAMIRAMLAAPSDSQLSGEPVPLIDVVSGASSRLEQTERVEAYWDLCSSVADYYLGLREKEELQRLRERAPGGGSSTVWQQAESEMAVRMNTSLRAARASQLRLASWINRGPGNLPLPEDMPHCGSYHSRYEEIFAGRPAAEAQELASLLPLRYAELKDASTAVTRAEEWLGGTVERGGASDGTGMLRALEFLALRRRAFVQIARDYNRRIARYTELASPGEIGAERLISMLIKTDSTSTATRPGSGPGRQSSTTTDTPPRTFAGGEGWEPAGERADASRRDESVRPASGAAPQEPRRERSLLVAPR